MSPPPNIDEPEEEDISMDPPPYQPITPRISGPPRAQPDKSQRPDYRPAPFRPRSSSSATMATCGSDESHRYSWRDRSSPPSPLSQSRNVSFQSGPPATNMTPVTPFLSHSTSTHTLAIPEDGRLERPRSLPPAESTLVFPNVSGGSSHLIQIPSRPGSTLYGNVIYEPKPIALSNWHSHNFFANDPINRNRRRLIRGVTADTRYETDSEESLEMPACPATGDISPMKIDQESGDLDIIMGRTLVLPGSGRQIEEPIDQVVHNRPRAESASQDHGQPDTAINSTTPAEGVAGGSNYAQHPGRLRGATISLGEPQAQLKREEIRTGRKRELSGPSTDRRDQTPHPREGDEKFKRRKIKGKGKASGIIDHSWEFY